MARRRKIFVLVFVVKIAIVGFLTWMHSWSPTRRLNVWPVTSSVASPSERDTAPRSVRSSTSACVYDDGLQQAANTSHRYLVVHARTDAAHRQAREAWGAVRNAARLLQGSAVSGKQATFTASLASCSANIEQIINTQLEARMGTLCILHVVLVVPTPLAWVRATYHESQTKPSTAASLKSQPAAKSLHDWVNDVMSTPPEFCLLPNSTDTDNPQCCLAHANPSQQLSAPIEASFSLQVSRWKERAKGIRPASQCRVAVTEVLPGNENQYGHPKAPSADRSNAGGILDALCLPTGPAARSGDVMTGLRRELQKLSLRRPTDTQAWDLQTHSRLSRFFEKSNSTRSSVREVLEGSALAHDTWVRTLKSAAANCSTADRTLVVVFCEVAYARIMLNWLAFYAALRRESGRELLPAALVVTSSRAVHDLLSRHYACSLYLSPIPSLNVAAAFWKTRLRVFLWLGRWHYTVVHSDVDALWLRNPVPALLRHLNATVRARFVFSQDIYPGEQKEKWGAAACMGLLAYRGGRKTSKTWMRAMQKFLQFKDDQRTVNSILDDGSLMFDKAEVQRQQGQLAGPARPWSCARTRLRNFTVCLLPQRFVLRQCAGVKTFDGVHVVHCHSGKQGASKEAMLRQKQLWRLTSAVQPADISQGMATLSQDDASLLFPFQRP